MPITSEQSAEARRGETATTLCATAPGMEPHLYRAIPVLDHGFVRVIDYMGDDAAISWRLGSTMGAEQNRCRTTRG